MEYKKILGLDLGTNSFGAALINVPVSISDFGKGGNIEWIGSRIIPVNGDYLKKWEEGKSTSADTKAAARRIKRGSRRLKQRYTLRRTRLIKVFKILGWLDDNFPENFKKEMNNNENFKFYIGDYLPFEQASIDEFEKELGIFGIKSKDKGSKKGGKSILPEDWMIYFLRKKGLTEKISIPELCRITYMMNQRRGFKSSRKDLKDENVEETKWVEILKIKSIEQITFEKSKDGNYKFKITPYSNRVLPWTVQKKKKPEWEEKEFTFLITEKTETKNDGKKSIKQNTPQIPKPTDWALCVTAQDNKIGNDYPGVYFFNGLVKNKNEFKIRQYAVYRSKYKKELETIWKKQLELNENLKKTNEDKTLLEKIAKALYPTQAKSAKPKLKEILSKDLLQLISDDIIYYQRELKSQKNSIGECRYEKLKGKDGETYGVKCAPKSSPEFQEFRIWQDIHNLRIFQKQGVINGFEKIDIEVTNKFIDELAKEKLFDLFDTSKEITQDNIFKEINKLNLNFKLNGNTHRINMFFNEDKKLLGNETKEYFRKIFRRKEVDYEIEGDKLLNDKTKFYKLWNIAYSISLNDEEKSKEAIKNALIAPRDKKNKTKQVSFAIPEQVANAIASAPEIEATRKYAAYSSKAINKLLLLMRCGSKWESPESIIEKLEKDKLENKKNNLKKGSLKQIESEIKSYSSLNKRIKEIIEYGWPFAADKQTGELIKERHFEKSDEFKGLPVWMACYVAYDRHSERVDSQKYSDLKQFNVMEKLPNNSLRNPIVEQVIRETLFVVKDIWEQYGQPDEIHIELGRDLKKNSKDRKKTTENSSKNFEEKKRIRKLLYELMNDGFEQYVNIGDDINEIKIENARFEINPNPESPVDIDKFKIWKNISGLYDADFDKKMKDEKIPKQQEIKKYALWLSQKCISPYTGRIIPLSKLFDSTQYEMEHVLPKGLVKNDSFDNLVIAEWGVNKAKSRELGALFIKNKNGNCEHQGKKYKLFDYAEYVAHCKNTFRGKKLKNLLATEIPEDFVSRQINDTRYITRKISELLYPIAKGKTDAEDGEKKGGIVFTIGSITSELKREWGLQKEWKKIVKPRFERLQQKDGKTYILANKKDRNDIDFNISIDENSEKELDIKRIDHRHHALDALIIAATTIEHTRYLNSLNAVDTSEEWKKVKRALVKGKIREFELPWPSFTEDVRKNLEDTIVTFKSYNQVISKPANKYFKWGELKNKNGDIIQDANGNNVYKKLIFSQNKPLDPNKKWMAVRKSMFKEPQGLIYIKEIDSWSFRTPKEMLDIVKLQIKRTVAQNTPAQKNTNYIYDQDTRELVKKIIVMFNGNLEAIEKYLKKLKPKDINGQPIYTVRVAIFKEYAAKRVSLNKDFDHKKIDKIPYASNSRIPIELHNHLLEYEIKKLANYSYNWKSDSKLSENQKKLIKEAQSEAFSDEGLEALGKKIGMKIKMVTIKEDIGLKKHLDNKLMEADGNPFYVMHENEITKERNGFHSLSSYDVIKRKREGKLMVDGKVGHKTILLQTNDLVYVPTQKELDKIKQGILEKEAIDWCNKKQIASRIYMVNNFSETDIYFKPNHFARAIIGKELHTSYDDKCTRLIVKKEKDNDGNDILEDAPLIKERCIKLSVNRLGNISLSSKEKYNYHDGNMNILEEPTVSYNKLTIQKHASFDDMENNQLKYFASLKPEQLLQNLKQMVLSAFGFREEPAFSSMPRTININPKP